MTLDEIFHQLQDLVNVQEKEYINIIYGDAWEFQFISHGSVKVCRVDIQKNMGITLKKFLDAVIVYKGIDPHEEKEIIIEPI